jgi:hypothetical protein
MPAWVKIFGAIYLITIAIFAASHLAGGWTGPLFHGEMTAHVSPAEHGRHQP